METYFWGHHIHVERGARSSYHGAIPGSCKPPRHRLCSGLGARPCPCPVGSASWSSRHTHQEGKESSRARGGLEAGRERISSFSSRFSLLSFSATNLEGVSDDDCHFRALVVAVVSLGALTAYAEECASGYTLPNGECAEPGGEFLNAAPACLPSTGRTPQPPK